MEARLPLASSNWSVLICWLKSVCHLVTIRDRFPRIRYHLRLWVELSLWWVVIAAVLLEGLSFLLLGKNWRGGHVLNLNVRCDAIVAISHWIWMSLLVGVGGIVAILVRLWISVARIGECWSELHWCGVRTVYVLLRILQGYLLRILSGKQRFMILTLCVKFLVRWALMTSVNSYIAVCASLVHKPAARTVRNDS